MTFWSLTNSDFPTNQTFHQFHDLDTELDLHRLWVVSMEHLQRVWQSSRERLPFRTPGSVPILGLANAPIVETKFLELAVSLLDFSPRIPLGTFSILLDKRTMWLSFCSFESVIMPCPSIWSDLLGTYSYHNMSPHIVSVLQLHHPLKSEKIIMCICLILHVFCLCRNGRKLLREQWH